jgi:hypothetical protein
MEDRWLSVEKIATYLGVSPGHGIRLDFKERNASLQKPEGFGSLDGMRLMDGSGRALPQIHLPRMGRSWACNHEFSYGNLQFQGTDRD